MKNNKDKYSQFNIPSWVRGNTPAEEAASVKRKFKDRKDKVSVETMEEILQSIADKQEFIKIEQGMASQSQEIPDQMGGQTPPGMEQYAQPQGGQPFANGGPMNQYALGGGVGDYYGSQEESDHALQNNQTMDKAMGTVASVNPIVSAGFAATDYLTPKHGQVGNEFQEGSEAFFKPWRTDQFRKDNKDFAKERYGDKSGMSIVNRPGSAVLMNANPMISGAIMKKYKTDVATHQANQGALKYNNEIAGTTDQLGSMGIQQQQQGPTTQTPGGGGGSNMAAYGGKINQYLDGGPTNSLCGGPGQVPCKQEKEKFDWAGMATGVLGAAASMYGSGAFQGGGGAAGAGAGAQFANMSGSAGTGLFAMGGPVNCGGPGQPPCKNNEEAMAANRAAMSESTKTAKKELAKEYVQKNFNEVGNHPLWTLPGSVAPMGALNAAGKAASQGAKYVASRAGRKAIGKSAKEVAAWSKENLHPLKDPKVIEDILAGPSEPFIGPVGMKTKEWIPSTAAAAGGFGTIGYGINENRKAKKKQDSTNQHHAGGPVGHTHPGDRWGPDLSSLGVRPDPRTVQGGPAVDPYINKYLSAVGQPGGQTPPRTVQGAPKAPYSNPYLDAVGGTPGGLAAPGPTQPEKGQGLKKAGEWLGRNYDNIGMLTPLANAFNKYEQESKPYRERLNPNYQETPTDLAAHKNIVAEQASAQRRAAAGSSQGSQTYLQKAMTGINKTAGDAVSKAYAGAEEVNRQQKHMGQLYGRQAGMFNAQQGNLDLTDARMDLAAVENARSANTAAVIEDTSAVARNMGDEQLIKQMFGYTRKGKYWIKPDGTPATKEEMDDAYKKLNNPKEYV